MENIELSLISDRENKLNKIKKVFERYATEGHILGSVARGDADAYSDLDVWITFPNKNFPRDLEKRLQLYKEVGEIIHICEPPQNAPENGIFTSVLYKTSECLLVVDFYLCPQSTSFITTESKNLFGNLQLPVGQTTLNPQKVSVPESYRIDFLICFIFNSIKKIIRKNEDALGALFQQYEYLKDRYAIDVEALLDKENTFSALEKVIENILKISNEKQTEALVEISTFIKQVNK